MYRQGKAFRREILDAALRLNTEALISGFSKSDAFPGDYGDVSVRLYGEEHYYTFTVGDDLSVVFLIEGHDNEIDLEIPMSVDGAILKIQELGEAHQWKLSGFYTLEDMTVKTNVLTATASNPPAMIKAFPSLTWIVSKEPAFTYAITSDNIISCPPASQQYSGNLILLPSHQEALYSPSPDRLATPAT
jgi:hypothetical protein